MGLNIWAQISASDLQTPKFLIVIETIVSNNRHTNLTIVNNIV